VVRKQARFTDKNAVSEIPVILPAAVADNTIDLIECRIVVDTTSRNSINVVYLRKSLAFRNLRESIGRGCWRFDAASTPFLLAVRKK